MTQEEVGTVDASNGPLRDEKGFAHGANCNPYSHCSVVIAFIVNVKTARLCHFMDKNSFGSPRPREKNVYPREPFNASLIK